MWRILWDNKELLASTMFPLVLCALLNGLNTVYSSISQCGSYSVCCTRTQRHVSLQCYGKRISETNFKRATEKIPVNWGHLSYLGNTLYLSRDSCDVHLWNNSFSFPDHSGTASLSLQNFPELNKLSICLRKSFFFSPGLCENSGQFQIIQTGDCECMQAWLCVCVYKCMPPRGAEVLCFDSIRCTGFNLPLFNSLSKSCIVHMKTEQTQRKKELFLNNKRQPVCFQVWRTLPLT